MKFMKCDQIHLLMEVPNTLGCFKLHDLLTTSMCGQEDLDLFILEIYCTATQISNGWGH